MVSGRLSQASTERLSRRVFTSDLSVDEFICLEEIGMEPLGLVLGTSVQRVGRGNQSTIIARKAMDSARSLAISRMEAEAEALGADGIVGVKFNINVGKRGKGLLEFFVVGTGIRARDRKLSARPQNAGPFSSNLSGQDLWKLVKIGYWPLRLCTGYSLNYMLTQTFSRGKYLYTFGNTEMETYTKAVYRARRAAMSEMESTASKAGADGIVGVEITERRWSGQSRVVEFFALGTAVVRQGTRRHFSAPKTAISLDRS